MTAIPLFEIPEPYSYEPRKVTVRTHQRSVTPRARATDPETSVEAAARVNREGVEKAILAEFASFAWFTDDKLADNLPHLHRETVKTARSRLKNAGLLVSTGTKRPSHHSCPSTVWKLVTP